MQLKDNTKYLLAFIIMLILAFIQCYKAVYGLHWAYEPDFDRDIGYIRNTLDGHFGTDPNIAGQYMWYNPLMYMTETLVVKITGVPINIVVARSGPFLNLLSPIVFFIVLVKLFDYKIALAGLLSFLFVSNGNLPGWGGATYSPLMLADCFVQFIFYINLFLCYKAFNTQKLWWFIALGSGIGIGFLGHAAPTIIIILILILLQGQKVIEALKEKNFKAVTTYVIQGIFTFIPFIIFAFPFLYFIWGKYRMHFVNRVILECAPGIFERKRSLELLKVNATVPLLIAAVGFVWFYKKFTVTYIRQIILFWFYITFFLYLYESALPTVDKLLHIDLPDTIPALHYFFYLKGVQSVFFAFGFVFLATWAINFIKTKYKPGLSAKYADRLLVFFVLLYAVGYYPIYMNRQDLVEPREQALAKEKQQDDLAIYYYIEKNIPLDRVILCEHDQSLFPVMATGIKMVSIGVYFSNPYISYDKRENDRDAMISYLTTSAPDSAQNLFAEYKVRYVLLANNLYAKYRNPPFATSRVLLQNKLYTLLELDSKNWRAE